MSKEKMKCMICNGKISDLAAWNIVILKRPQICHNCHKALCCSKNCHCYYRQEKREKERR